jgi:hypothetical protein
MRSSKAILIVLLTTATLAAATERPVLWTTDYPGVFEVSADDGDIYSSVPMPTGYSRGVGYDGTSFWSGKPTDSTVVKYNKNGTIIDTFNIPLGEITGALAYAESSLWYLTYVEWPGDILACHMDLSGELIPPEPFPVNEYSVDITWDGEYLWVVTNGADFWRARCYDVETGVCVDSFYVGDTFYETETYSIGTDGTYIYTIGFERLHDGGTSYIYKYSKTGTLLDHVYTPVDGWNAEIAYWEEEISVIEPRSFGVIKACFR